MEMHIERRHRALTTEDVSAVVDLMKNQLFAQTEGPNRRQIPNKESCAEKSTENHRSRLSALVAPAKTGEGPQGRINPVGPRRRP